MTPEEKTYEICKIIIAQEIPSEILAFELEGRSIIQDLSQNKDILNSSPKSPTGFPFFSDFKTVLECINLILGIYLILKSKHNKPKTPLNITIQDVVSQIEDSKTKSIIIKNELIINKFTNQLNEP